VAGIRMAIEAERDGILLTIAATIGFLDDVMDFDPNALIPMADTTMTRGSNQRRLTNALRKRQFRPAL